MRIRKRPLLPISSSPPFPLQTQDPSLQEPEAGEDSTGRRTQPRQEGGGRGGGGLHSNGDVRIDPHGLRDLPPSDPHPTTESPSHPNDQVLQEEEEEMMDSHKIWNSTQANSKKRNGSSPGAEAIVEATLAFPLKRRIEEYGINRRGGGEERLIEKKKGKVKARAKATITTTKLHTSTSVSTSSDTTTATNKKCHYVEGSGGERVDGNGKKRRSPAVLMEGSRCSRVNGRGWRCGQQTLVGYSLCEHHLGKGRLKSMSSVRSQTGPNVPKKEEEKAATKVEKTRKKKIVSVKARSINSLLDQSSHSTTTTTTTIQTPSEV